MSYVTRILPTALIALSLAAPAASAAVVNLDDLVGFSNGTAIQTAAPGYGSEGPVTLNWHSTTYPLLLWNGDYSGRSAAYCNSGAGCTLDMTVDAGYSMTLASFFLGGWPNTDRTISWSVIDLFDSSVVASTLDAFVSGTTGVVNTIGASSTAGFRILFGPDGFNGGINDITYSYARLGDGGGDDGGASPVPLPAAGWLMIAGLGGLAALRRRRKAA